MRAYSALLRLLPASFRHEYADEMLALHARRRRDAQGPLASLALWAGAVLDVAACAARVHLDILRQDLRYVGRSLGRAKGFALTVVAVTALGVGATTAAFSVTDHVLLRPLPFPDAGRLVQLWQTQRDDGSMRVELSPANFRDWRSRSTSFEALGAFHRGGSANLVGDGPPERLSTATVTADVLALVGVRPLLGRPFAADDDREGAPGTLLLSYGLWQQRFGGESSVVGRKLLLDDVPYQVIGVMPRGFHFPRRETQVWLPMRFEAGDFERRDDLYLETVGRLRPGVSEDAALAELTLVTAQLEQQYPRENKGVGASVMRLRDQLSQQSRLLLLALFGAALGLLLIACTNLASLLLARAVERRRELAVRTALGAGRERLARQLMTESLLLAATGGVLGVALAFAALPLVVRLVPNALPIGEAPPVDLRVLAFAALMTLVTAIGFGLAPLLRGFGNETAAGLREGARAGAGRERLRSALVMAEVTLAVVLLVSSGLLIRALLRVQSIDPGFDPAGVVTLRTTLPMPKYRAPDARAGFYAAVLGEVRRLPGVTAAGYISHLPMVMTGGIWTIEAEGRPTQPGDPRTASLRYVTPGYFAALRIPIVAGRDVSESDTAGALQAAVVSQAFVDRYWPGENPIGRRFRFGLLGGEEIAAPRPFQDRTIVGVVGNVKVRGLERRSEPQVYLPNRQQPEDAMGWYTPQDLAVRHAGDASALVPALRRIVARVDATLAVADVRTLEAIVDTQTAPRRVQVRVLAGFAALAVLLAGVGIHGLVAFTVASRAREIGVRRALGARTSDIARLVLGQGARLAVAGVGLGLVVAYAAGQGLQALLAGVSPRDVSTFAAAAFVAGLTAFAGCLLPAWRAVRVDPARVMRVE
ncbi:MAG TPA: ABC transporter permease [Vicinamibacteria bacterium]